MLRYRFASTKYLSLGFKWQIYITYIKIAYTDLTRAAFTNTDRWLLAPSKLVYDPPINTQEKKKKKKKKPAIFSHYISALSYPQVGLFCSLEKQVIIGYLIRWKQIYIVHPRLKTSCHYQYSARKIIVSESDLKTGIKSKYKEILCWEISAESSVLRTFS